MGNGELTNTDRQTTTKLNRNASLPGRDLPPSHHGTKERQENQ
jgi:hypothetical protein